MEQTKHNPPFPKKLITNDIMNNSHQVKLSIVDKVFETKLNRNSLINEIKKWCVQNVDHRWFHLFYYEKRLDTTIKSHSFSFQEEFCIMYFEDEADAVLFKLRW